MALFLAEQHPDNPPDSWKVVKVGRLWYLQTKDGSTLQSCSTKKAAERLKTEGFYVNLYEKEGRWYDGENIPGWRPYAECLAARR